MNKLFSLFILMSFLLYFQSCNTVDANHSCEPECKDWEICDSVENDFGEITSTCIHQEGRCENQTDCNYPQSCNTKTNWCIGNCRPICESWERCSLSDECKTIEGYCNTNNDCGQEKPICNKKTHECNYNCQTQCESWEICTKDEVCKADEEKNFCNENSNCKDGKICNTDRHKCEYNGCNPKCEDWQECNENGTCTAASGRCDPEIGCERNSQASFTCNPNSHICTKDSGNCSPICDLWQTCNRDNKCVAATGFCNQNDECATGYKCNSEHICIPVNGTFCNANDECNSWEYCEDNRCKVKQGSCSLIEDCIGNAICDFISHKCETPCETPCQYWESCSTDGTTCSLDNENYCLNDNHCKNNEHCNLSSHKCENTCRENCAPWGTCGTNGECGVNDGYCDGTEGCGTTFGYSATCDLDTHTCKEDPSSGCDPFCKSWEECSLNNQCEIAAGRCTSNLDCGAGKYCSRVTHLCKPEPSSNCTPSCNSMEYCANGNICRKIEGTCSTTSECSGTDICKNNECQDPDPASCSPVCNPWEVCNGNDCKLRVNRCISDNDCANGKKCDTISHLCKYTNCQPSCNDWETCNNDGTCSSNQNRCSDNSDCPAGLFCDARNHTCGTIEYCDGSEDCGTTFGYSATCNLNTHTCEEDPSSECDPFCKSWEECLANNQCEMAAGRCTENSDCGINKYCSRVSHTCKQEPSNGCTPDCSTTEYCDSGNICKKIEGTCTSTSECYGTDICKNNECQEPDPAACSPVCNPWEVCSNNSCKVRDERCSDDSNCNSNELCNTETHICNDNSCLITCQPWEQCSENECIINDGRCNDGEDCPSNKYCEITTHSCKSNPNGTICNPDCEPWERCLTENCQLAEGFCTENSQCSEEKRCSENHVCVNDQPNGCETDDDCQGWQFCSSSKQCIHRDEYCDSTSNCEGKETCNRETHKCEIICNPICESWQECNTQAECINQEGKCGEDSDCKENEICLDLHTCSKRCKPQCESYQNCIEGECLLGDQFCEDDSNCSDEEKCNTNTHVCELECPTDCEEWEVCSNSFGQDLICKLRPGRCSDEDYGNTTMDNYGCSSSSATVTISCNLETHTCYENEGTCEEQCGSWEECTVENECKPMNRKCNENIDCYGEMICDIENHDCISNGITVACITDADCEKDWEHCGPEGACVLDVNACNSNADCPEERYCEMFMHQCVKKNDQCIPPCGEWQTCNMNMCRADESRFKCDMQDYCGAYSLCSSKTHNCENISDNCGTCNQWEVCLESGCSLIYGNCNSDMDCSYNKTCNTANHLCEYKTCTNDRDCFADATTDNNICIKKNGASTGYCQQAFLDEIREMHGYNKTSLENNKHRDFFLGKILAIYKNATNIGFYIYLSPENSDEYYRGCNCTYNADGTISECDLDSNTNLSDCPLYKYLYKGLYLTIQPEEYSKFNQYKIGDELMGHVQYFNHYGMSMAMALKGYVMRVNRPCDPDSEVDVCATGQQCDSVDRVCRDIKPFNPYYYNIRAGQIFQGNGNRAEAYESLLVNAVDNKPYTVIKNASSSNNFRTTLKDSYDEEFYIDKELTGDYSLNRGTGQCINNECKKESWISCNKYCENGFKLIQEDTDKDSVGDTCQNTKDIDGDGIEDSNDNCVYDYNPNQENQDGDNKGDACDEDLDGDGWRNSDDNCPLISNPNQAYNKNCSTATLPGNASFNGNGTGQITRNTDGSWNEIIGCDWSCDEGYVGDNCDDCDEGYHLDDSNTDCIPDNKKFTTITPPPPPRGGAWGSVCNHTNDTDWDGVIDSVDNCVNIFNPVQSDFDHDNIGDKCDTDMDGDSFLNDEDNCVYYYNPILCKVCECAPAVISKYSCTDNNNCGSIDVRGHNSGSGKCHYYETTLRTLSGVLKYEHETPASKVTCTSNSDCSGNETCKLFGNSETPNEMVGGLCTAGNKPDDGSYIIMPRSSSDMSKCHNEDCTY